MYVCEREREGEKQIATGNIIMRYPIGRWLSPLHPARSACDAPSMPTRRPSPALQRFVQPVAARQALGSGVKGAQRLPHRLQSSSFFDLHLLRLL